MLTAGPVGGFGQQPFSQPPYGYPPQTPFGRGSFAPF
jgi:hypothetical protein